MLLAHTTSKKIIIFKYKNILKFYSDRCMKKIRRLLVTLHMSDSSRSKGVEPFFFYAISQMSSSEMESGRTAEVKPLCVGILQDGKREILWPGNLKESHCQHAAQITRGFLVKNEQQRIVKKVFVEFRFSRKNRCIKKVSAYLTLKEKDKKKKTELLQLHTVA